MESLLSQFSPISYPGKSMPTVFKFGVMIRGRKSISIGSSMRSRDLIISECSSAPAVLWSAAKAMSPSEMAVGTLHSGFSDARVRRHHFFRGKDPRAAPSRKGFSGTTPRETGEWYLQSSSIDDRKSDKVREITPAEARANRILER